MTKKRPLLELVEKLMFSDYVKDPICAICFEFSKGNKKRVFTIKSTKNHLDEDFFENNELDLTLSKFITKKFTLMNPEEKSTKPPVNEFVKRTINTNTMRSVAQVVYETEIAVLVKELIRTKYLDHSDILINEYEVELRKNFKSKNLSYGYIGIHPYTIKNVKNEAGPKTYFSIYWGIKQFTQLDPDAGRIPKNKIGMKG